MDAALVHRKQEKRTKKKRSRRMNRTTNGAHKLNWTSKKERHDRKSTNEFFKIFNNSFGEWKIVMIVMNIYCIQIRENSNNVLTKFIFDVFSFFGMKRERNCSMLYGRGRTECLECACVRALCFSYICCFFSLFLLLFFGQSEFPRCFDFLVPVIVIVDYNLFILLVCAT